MGRALKERKIREQGQKITNLNTRNNKNALTFVFILFILALSIGTNIVFLFISLT